MVSGKEYDKEGDAYGNGSTLYARTDRGRPEKTPKPSGERGGKDTRGSRGISGQRHQKGHAAGLHAAGHTGLARGCGVSVPLTKLKALFDKAPGLEPVKEQNGAEEDTPPPHEGNSNGEWGSADGV